MAIDTAQKRFSAMNLMCPWRGIVVLPSGTIGAAARQTVRWFYSGILAAAGVTIAFVSDLNTRLLIYLQAYYATSENDLNVLTQRYLQNELTGDYTLRMRQLIADATDAMS